MNNEQPRQRFRPVTMIGTSLGVVALTMAALVGFGSSASALGPPYVDLDNIDVTPLSSSYGDGDLVDLVEDSGTAAIADGTYNLAVCQYAPVVTTVAPGVTAPVPACSSAITSVTVTGGAFSVTDVELQSTYTNAHSGVGPEQPVLVDLDANLGEFVLVPTHSSTTAPVADSHEFNVS